MPAAQFLGALSRGYRNPQNISVSLWRRECRDRASERQRLAPLRKTRNSQPATRNREPHVDLLKPASKGPLDIEAANPGALMVVRSFDTHSLLRNNHLVTGDLGLAIRCTRNRQR